ncbi:MAG: allene oxide cyclase barrel-like domain-containing protein [Acidimicrobiia bacterium]
MVKLLVGAVTLAAGAFVGLALAGSAGGAAEATELRLFSHDTQQTFLDLGPIGESAGDRFLFGADVFDGPGGNLVGRLAGSCDTVTRDAGGRGETVCAATFAFDGAQLVTAFMGDTAGLAGGKPMPFSVTGGTGTYRDVRGHGTITMTSPTDASFVVQLS